MKNQVIPAQAVEAALAANRAYKSQRSMDNAEKQMLAVLEAAAPHMLAGAFAYGWREGKGIPTPCDTNTEEPLHEQAQQPNFNPYRPTP